MNLLRPMVRPVAYGIAIGILVAVVVGAVTLVAGPAVSLAVAAGLVAGTVVALHVRLRGRLARATNRLETLQRHQVKLEDQVADLEGIATFSAVDVPYPLPLGGSYGLGWDAAAVLAREVGSTRPDVVVELGSGGSSLVIGLQLRAAEHGHLYTLDHDPRFAAATRRHVAALGLERWVTVLDAPLVACTVNGESYRWYDLPDAVAALPHIDLLVVDGPPQSVDRGGMPRYPALPVLSRQLGPGSIVFVDDMIREAEQRMVDRWLLEEPDLVHEPVRTRHGLAILHRPA